MELQFGKAFIIKYIDMKFIEALILRPISMRLLGSGLWNQNFKECGPHLQNLKDAVPGDKYCVYHSVYVSTSWPRTNTIYLRLQQRYPPHTNDICSVSANLQVPYLSP